MKRIYKVELGPDDKGITMVYSFTNIDKLIDFVNDNSSRSL